MTLRHNVKTTAGDSWASPVWAVVLPGGVGVDLDDDWQVAGSLTRRDGNLVWNYLPPDGITLGRATITLSDGRQIQTSTVQLTHSGQASNSFPISVGSWDCQISKGQQTYTIVSGSFRTTRGVTP